VRDAYYAYAASHRADVWIALGDNAYGSGTDEEYQANFFDGIPTSCRTPPFGPPLATTNPIAPDSMAPSLRRHLLLAHRG